MAKADARRHGAPGSGDFELTLVDPAREGFRRLRDYLRGQLVKAGEKRISELREWARDREDLVENGEIIDAWVDGALSMLRFDTDPAAAHGARLVFEAVFERRDVKRDLYRRLARVCAPDTWYFTNTSSIPIAALARDAGLEGRLIGYHFYNPPAVQKLVEVITAPGTDPSLAAFATGLGPVLEKTLVPSRDVAGFIGNGHFIREGLFALEQAQALMAVFPAPEAFYLVNKVTQEFLARPMGIFQLLDYVGWDVFRMILEVMGEHLPGEIFRHDLGDRIFAAGILGGQAGSGEQKDGLFKYEKNRMTAVFDPSSGSHLPLSDPRFGKAAAWLGPLPAGHAPWNVLSRDPAKADRLRIYFDALAHADTRGARLARLFLDHSREAAGKLVGTGVAASGEDVKQVLMLGFFHLYGPMDWKQG
jgi:3-hydroxyacyl-CoA dehydrogenase